MVRTSILMLFAVFWPGLAESTLAIAGASNGLYLSRDRGYTWEKNAALGEVVTRAVAIDRFDLKRLYAVTSDTLLVSEDGGANWTPGEFAQPAKIQRLRTAGEGVVFALADGSIWSSSNGGKHWRNELGVPDRVVDLVVGAGAPPTVYALTEQALYSKSGGSAWMNVAGVSGGDAIAADPDVPGALLRAKQGRFAHSTDGGITWTDLPPIPARTEVRALGYTWSGVEPEFTVSVVGLAFGQDPAAVIALGAGSITWDGEFISGFMGSFMRNVAIENRDWRKVPLSGLSQLTALAVDRASNLALAGGQPYRGSGLYRSNAARTDWTAIGLFDGIGVNGLAIATVDLEPRSLVYAGTSEGLFSSSDGGDTWQSNAELGKTPVFAVGVDQGGSGLLLVSTSDGLYRSADAGAIWEKSELPPGIQASVITIDAKSEGRAYLIDRNGRRENRLRLWTSEDRGRSWYQVPSQPEGISDLALDPKTTPATIYVAAGRLGVMKSTDEALTWTPAYSGGTVGIVRVGEPAGTIYCDGEDGAWKTENGGGSWHLIGPPISSVSPFLPEKNLIEFIVLEDLAVGSGRSDGLIAAYVTYYAFGLHVDITADHLVIFDGDRWRSSPRSFRNAEFDPRAAGLMYAGGVGLWRSADAGRSWSQTPGFENLVVSTIATGPPASRTKVSERFSNRIR